MKKNKLIGVLVIFFIIISIVAFFILKNIIGGKNQYDTKVNESLSSNDSDRFNNPEETTSDGRLKESMILSADCTNYTVGSPSETILTIYIPTDIISDDIIINDDFNNEVCRLDSSSAIEENGYSKISTTIKIDAENEGVLFYTAHMGEYVSNTLTIYVTPNITDEQLELCEKICADLADYMSEIVSQNELTIEEELAEAKKWISQNNDIEDYIVDGSTILFATKDSIIGFYTVEEDGYFGSSANNDSSYEYKYSGPIIDAYNMYGSTNKISTNDSFLYLDSGNSNTNNNVLVLRPLYNTNYYCHISYHSDYGEKIAQKLNGSCTVIDDNSSMVAIANKTMNNYGTVIFNSHGGQLTRTNGSKLFYTVMGEYSVSYCDEFFEALLSYDYDDERNVYTEQEFRNLFYGNFGESDSYRLMYGVSGSSRCIAMTSNYIMDTYQDTFFDNSVIYFGVCFGYCDGRLNNFFINHGAQAYVSYDGSIQTDLEKDYFKMLMNAALSKDKKINYNALNKFETVFEKDLSLGASAHRTFLRIVDRNEDSVKDYSAIYNPKYTYYGNKDLTATIQGYDEEKPVKWFNNSSVSAYRFENQGFKLQATGTTDENGKITFEDLRFGCYVFVVKDKHNEIYLTSLLYDNLCPDGQEIKFDVEINPYYEYIKDELLPELGYANLEANSKYLNSDNVISNEDWDRREGIVSADIIDMNSDGTDDLLVYYFDSKYPEYANGKLVANLYTTSDDGTIELVGSLELWDEISDINYKSIRIGLMEIDGQIYLHSEEIFSSYFVQGSRSASYGWYGYDGERFRPYWIIDESGGGMVVSVCSLFSYTDLNTYTKTDIWADYNYEEIYPEMSPLTVEGELGDAFEKGLSLIGLDNPEREYRPYSDLNLYADDSLKNIVPSYWNNDDIKRTMEYTCSGQGDSSSRSMETSIVDETDLQKHIEELED